VLLWFYSNVFKMYIYLDETFNLKKGSKNQFLAIAGFSPSKPKDLAKRFNTLKRLKLPRSYRNIEVKSTDRITNKSFKPTLLKQIAQRDIEIYCNIQFKNQLPLKYFRQNKLDYDLLYLDLLTDLLAQRWRYDDNKVIIITLDTFQTKRIDKGNIIHLLRMDLVKRYPSKHFTIYFETSADYPNLQIADFICGAFSDDILGSSINKALLSSKIIKITKNPL